jgi:hypothetical protein
MSSIIENLFLRSALAIGWIIEHSAWEAQAKGRSQPAERRGKRIGRPPDTDPMRDRRIAEAWKTNRHETLEDLALAFNMTKPEAKRALDRHRHRERDGKRPPRKSSQEP